MEIVNYNGTSLAFIGDAWMSLKVRMRVLEQGYQRPRELQRRCSSWECAHAQARMLRQLEEEAFFDEDEQEISIPPRTQCDHPHQGEKRR